MVGLNIDFKIPNGEEYIVKVGKKTMVVNEEFSNITLEVPKSNPILISIEQRLPEELNKFLRLFLSILSAPIRGFFNILFFNNDTHWENYIVAYLLKVDAEICVSENLEINIELLNSRFDNNKDEFEPPKIVSDFPLSERISYESNEKAIAINFQNYISRLFSVYFWIVTLFTSLIHYGIKNNREDLALIGRIILLSMVAVAMICIIYEYKKYKKIVGIFRSHNLAED